MFQNTDRYFIMYMYYLDITIHTNDSKYLFSFPKKVIFV